MATATLELINPYAKYGLKRRPTYEEICNLISENETITGKLPNRDATFFKASPEGSFFDGLDHLELLKEQQNRIHERQLRELLLRQNLGNNTYNVARIQQQRREGISTNVEVPRDENLHEASIQTELHQRARRAMEREQQTGEGHRQGFLSGTVTPMIGRIFNIATPNTPSTPVPQLQMPSPQRPISEPSHTSSDVEEVTSGEMMTARTEQHIDRIIETLISINSNASAEELSQAYDILSKYKKVSPETMANRFSIMNTIYDTLYETGFIPKKVVESYYKKTNELSGHTNRRKQDAVRQEIIDNYKRNIYDKFINPASSSGS